MRIDLSDIVAMRSTIGDGDFLWVSLGRLGSADNYPGSVIMLGIDLIVSEMSLGQYKA